MEYNIAIAAEIEWYIFSKDGKNIDDILRGKYKDNFINYPLILENGIGQVETISPIFYETIELINWLENVKEYAYKIAAMQNLIADFSAKPKLDDYGSGLHIHLHLEEKGENIFQITNGVLSKKMQNAIAGLLETADKNMEIFAKNGWKNPRYIAKFNAPTKLDWGYNNRNCAIRIPDNMGNLRGYKDIAKTISSPYRRIEHRLACGDSDPQKIIEAIIYGVNYGLKNKPNLPQPNYN